jgi:long-chain acyl-CoA synthetase
MIITESGEKVEPDEVEEVYQDNPVIREAGGLQRDRRLVALIVPEAGPKLGDAKQQGEVDRAIRRAAAQPAVELRPRPSVDHRSDFTQPRRA